LRRLGGPEDTDVTAPIDSVYRAHCASRFALEQLADKWTILILSVLCEHPTRFNAIRRRLEGVTQKALTQALRRLERNGLVAREVIASSPVAVEYRITPLGRSLREPLAALQDWTVQHGTAVVAARDAYDAAAGQAGGARVG
jgi:DNA-binding HxlR family transcriptional regulator